MDELISTPVPSNTSDERQKLLQSKSDKRLRLIRNTLEQRQSNRNEKWTEISHCCLFIIIMITILGALIGLFFLAKVSFDDGSAESCQLIPYDKLLINENTTIVKNVYNLNTILSSIATSIGLSKNKDNNPSVCSCSDGHGDNNKDGHLFRQKDTNQTVPYSYMLHMVSSDNLVKVAFRGYMIIEDLADKYIFVSNWGAKATLSHHLTSNVPTIKISFYCGEIVFYINSDLHKNDSKNYNSTSFSTIMLTGKTNSGIIYGHNEFFEWRTPTLSKPIFLNVLNKEHYYCADKREIKVLIHQETNFQLTLVLEHLEFEIFRPSEQSKDEFATPKGVECDNSIV